MAADDLSMKIVPTIDMSNIPAQAAQLRSQLSQSVPQNAGVMNIRAAAQQAQQAAGYGTFTPSAVTGQSMEQYRTGLQTDNMLAQIGQINSQAAAAMGRSLGNQAALSPDRWRTNAGMSPRMLSDLSNMEQNALPNKLAEETAKKNQGEKNSLSELFGMGGRLAGGGYGRLAGMAGELAGPAMYGGAAFAGLQALNNVGSTFNARTRGQWDTAMSSWSPVHALGVNLGNTLFRQGFTGQREDERISEMVQQNAAISRSVGGVFGERGALSGEVGAIRYETAAKMAQTASDEEKGLFAQIGGKQQQVARTAAVSRWLSGLAGAEISSYQQTALSPMMAPPSIDDAQAASMALERAMQGTSNFGRWSPN